MNQEPHVWPALTLGDLWECDHLSAMATTLDFGHGYWSKEIYRTGKRILKALVRRAMASWRGYATLWLDYVGGH